MDISAKITERMNELGLTVDSVAHELHIDQSTFYRKLASGGTKFTLEQLQRLVDILQYSKEEATLIFFPQ